MIYPFSCPKCRSYVERIWRLAEYTDIVPCEKCGTLMHRVYPAPQVIVPQLGGYNHGLGCPQNRVKDKIKELRDQGRDLVEVGNERVKPRTGGDPYALTEKDKAMLARIDDSKTVKDE